MSKLAAFLRRGAPAALAALLLLGAVPAAAEEAGAKVYAPELSFRSYTYSRWGDPIACPDPVHGEKVVTGVDLGVGDFKKPNDMFASADGYLYIAASGDTAADNRVVKLDKNLQVVGSFSGYIGADGQTVAFKEPLGVFITAENDIYVADGTSSKHPLDAAGKLKRIIAAPSSEDSAIIDADFVERYRPSKLVVDSSGRIHVVAINVNEGIVEFDPDGKFEASSPPARSTPTPSRSSGKSCPPRRSWNGCPISCPSNTTTCPWTTRTLFSPPPPPSTERWWFPSCAAARAPSRARWCAG